MTDQIKEIIRVLKYLKHLNEWEVCLKSIILPCCIWNIYEEYNIYWKTKYVENGGIKNNYFEVQNGCYGVEDILHLIK